MWLKSHETEFLVCIIQAVVYDKYTLYILTNVDMQALYLSVTLFILNCSFPMHPNIKAIMFLNNNRSEKENLHDMEKEKLSPAVNAAPPSTSHCHYFYNDPHALQGPLQYFAAKNSRLLLSPIVWGKNLSLKEVKFFA